MAITATGTGTGGVSLDVTSLGTALGGTVISSIISSSYAKSDARKQRQLAEQLAKLELAQQKELAERIQDVEGDIKKQEIISKYLAEQKNNEMLANLKSKRYTSYMVLGGGVLALAIVVLFLKNKK